MYEYLYEIDTGIVCRYQLGIWAVCMYTTFGGLSAWQLLAARTGRILSFNDQIKNSFPK